MLSHSNYDHGYDDFQKRIVRRLKSEKIQHQILERLATTFDAVLADENIIVSRAERKRLLTQVSRDILEDMLKKLDSSSTASK
jgi:hypothetical protein